MSLENKRSICDIPTDGNCIDLNDIINLYNDCSIPPGACFTIKQKIVDSSGHEVDGDWQKTKDGKWVERKGKCTHKNFNKVKKEEKIVKEETETEIQTDTKTVSIIEVRKKEPIVKKQTSFENSLPILAGLLGGIIGPMLLNFIKGKIKKQTKQEDKEEPTDCKTHQIKSNAKILNISKRLTIIEQNLNKQEKNSDIDFDLEKIEDIAERIEKLEKLLNNNKK